MISVSKKRTLRWVVQGYDGQVEIFRYTLPKGPNWGEPRIIELLRRLICRHLTADDIINASRAPRDKLFSSELEERRATEPRLHITVGSNPFYVATLWQPDEQDH